MMMEQPEVTIRQPYKTMYWKVKNLFDEIQDEMKFKIFVSRHQEIIKFLESLKRKVIHDCDITISINELSAEYEKKPIL